MCPEVIDPVMIDGVAVDAVSWPPVTYATRPFAPGRISCNAHALATVVDPNVTVIVSPVVKGATDMSDVKIRSATPAFAAPGSFNELMRGVHVLPTESAMLEYGSAPFVPLLSYAHTRHAHDRAAKFEPGVTTMVDWPPVFVEPEPRSAPERANATSYSQEKQVHDWQCATEAPLGCLPDHSSRFSSRLSRLSPFL